MSNYVATLKWFAGKVIYVIGRVLKLIQVALLLALFCSPLVGSRQPTLLEQILDSGKLVVISRNGPTTYYEDANGYTGFEYILAKRFANHLGVKLEIKEIEDLGVMIDSVGFKGHFAAAGLSVTPRREQAVTFAHPYMEVTQQLIYNADLDKPKSIQDLVGKKLLVIGNSSHAERLRQLQKTHPDLAWEERHDMEMLDLLEMVHNRKVDYAIIDSNAYELNNNLYPKAQVAMNISDPEPLAWAFPKSSDTSLITAANEFLVQFEQKGALAEVKEKFYGHLGEVGYSGALVFTRRMEERLPKWEAQLKAAAETNELDWILLAALSYQESHWNPKAKSPTGVRGFMMLTLNTAKEMEVKNRLNAEQSIIGGAKYFRKLLNRIPERIQGPDRIWLALAAYNVGFGHVEDARILAQHNGANPDRWSDVKEYLPLLSKRQYYKFTKHGYARGQEAVSYVQNIRNFYNILAWNQVEQERLTELAMNDSAEEGSEFNSIISQVVENQSFTSSM